MHLITITYIKTTALMIWLVGFMVFNTIFNNISVISWWLLLLKGSKKKIRIGKSIMDNKIKK